MRFLVDQPVSPLLAQWLREQGHDTYHAREQGLSRATDEELFARAVQEDRIIVTADLDFPRILALSGVDRPGLVLFRAGNVSDDRMLELLKTILSTVGDSELRRSVVVAEPGTLRIAPLPLRPDLAP